MAGKATGLTLAFILFAVSACAQTIGGGSGSSGGGGGNGTVANSCPTGEFADGIVDSDGTLTCSPLPDTADHCVDAGSTDAYACDYSPAISGYVAEKVYRFRSNTANTGPATININSKGAVAIKKAVGGVTTDLADNDIRAEQEVVLVYDGVNMQMVSLLGNVPTPGGSTGYVQYNSSSTFAGDAGLTYDPATDTLTVGTQIVVPGAGAGYTEWSIGAMSPGAAGTIRCGAHTGGVFACSSDGGAVTAVGSGGAGNPAGSDTQVQFNDGGSTFGGDAGLTYNKTTNFLTNTGGGITINSGGLIADSVTAGTTPATAGSVRIGSQNTIRSRNAANSADHVLATLDASDRLKLGNTSIETVIPAGAGTNLVRSSGVMDTCKPNTGDLPTTINSGEEVLYTCTLPANTLNANGKSVRITATFKTAANGNTKIPRIRLGTSGSGLTGTECSGSISYTSSAAKGSIVCLITRQAAGDQVYSSWTQRTTDGLTFFNEGDMTRDETTALDLVVTGSTLTAAGDLTIRNVLVEFFN